MGFKFLLCLSLCYGEESMEHLSPRGEMGETGDTNQAEQVEAGPPVTTPQGDVCKDFSISGIFGINGDYHLLKMDEEGFPVYAFHTMEHFVYVFKTDDALYWHFSFIAGENKAWMYSTYTQNCPIDERSGWSYWNDGGYWTMTPSITTDRNINFL